MPRPAIHHAPPGRKARTADCRNCVIMSGLLEAGLRPSSVQAICDSLWINRARPRQLLYCEDNGATHLYAIRTGRVKLFRTDTAGRDRVTAVLGPGDLFGFEAVFDEAYDCCAETLTDCELCLASADQLRRLMAEVPALTTDLARYLHHQLSRARARQAALTATRASAKIAGYLLHCLSEGRGDAGETPTVAADLSLTDLGGILGLSSETVCRVLSGLKSKGVVRSDAAGIRVLDIQGLRREARA